jgi:hypothetical protein
VVATGWVFGSGWRVNVYKAQFLSTYLLEVFLLLRIL